jgi:hypothetical protein
MDPRGVRAMIAGAIVVAAAVVLFVVLHGGGGSSSETAGRSGEPSQKTILVRDAKPVGGIQELTYHHGDRVRIKVQSDVADEVHVHGYDFMKDVPRGGSVSFDFPASIEGAFEIELESRKQQLAELKVEP